MVSLFARVHPLRQPAADALGGFYRTDYPFDAERAVAECRRLGVRSLDVDTPQGVLPDREFKDVSWVGELADQLVDLTIGLDASGHESWPVFPRLKRFSAGAWSGEIQFSLFPALLELGLDEPKRHFEVFPSEARALRHLWLAEYRGTDLSWLEPLSLRSLVITNSRRLESLAGIETQTDLEHLEVALCPKLTDISALDGLENLVSLSIESCNRVSDLSVLSTLSGMRYLSLLTMRRLGSIAALSGLPRLEAMFLEVGSGVDLEPLRQLPSLRSVLGVSDRHMKSLGDAAPPEDYEAWSEAIEFRRSVESVDPAELREDV